MSIEQLTKLQQEINAANLYIQQLERKLSKAEAEINQWKADHAELSNSPEMKMGIKKYWS